LWLNLREAFGLRVGCAPHLGRLVSTLSTRHPGQGSCDEHCEGKTQGLRTQAGAGADGVTPETVHAPLNNFEH
jgi:hypothetical protein